MHTLAIKYRTALLSQIERLAVAGRHLGLSEIEMRRAVVDGFFKAAATPEQEIFADIMRGDTTIEEARTAWPAGCHKPNSCSRNRSCMYGTSPSTCRHFGREIGPEVEAETEARELREANIEPREPVTPLPFPVAEVPFPYPLNGYDASRTQERTPFIVTQDGTRLEWGTGRPISTHEDENRASAAGLAAVAGALDLTPGPIERRPRVSPGAIAWLEQRRDDCHHLSQTRLFPPELRERYLARAMFCVEILEALASDAGPAIETHEDGRQYLTLESPQGEGDGTCTFCGTDVPPGEVGCTSYTAADGCAWFGEGDRRRWRDRGLPFPGEEGDR